MKHHILLSILCMLSFKFSIHSEEWKVTVPPSELKLHSFYEKYVSVKGYPVISSGK